MLRAMRILPSGSAFVTKSVPRNGSLGMLMAPSSANVGSMEPITANSRRRSSLSIMLHQGRRWRPRISRRSPAGECVGLLGKVVALPLTVLSDHALRLGLGGGLGFGLAF